MGVPFYKYSAYWRRYDEAYRYKTELLTLLAYTATLCEKHSLSFDFIAAKAAVENGWGIESNIPEGYGLGSSGAIVVLLVKRYVKDVDALSTLELKSLLANIEGFFHGTSSGMDPLVSYYEKPLLVNEEACSVLEKKLDTSCFYLYDSKIKRSAKPLIKKFKMKLSETAFSEAVKVLAALNSKAIERMQLGVSVEEEIKAISKWQLEHFKFLIPVQLHELWQNCYDKGVYMKLCGAGGGGVFLIYATEEAIASLSHDLALIPIEKP